MVRLQSLSRFVPTFRPFQTTTSTTSHLSQQTAQFSSSPTTLARKQRVVIDPRITLIRQHLWHPLTPRPLRLSRQRSLRHWTISRAWNIFQQRTKAARLLDLQRQYYAMREANEKLRLLGDDGVVGGKNTGRLYRQSMEKTGVWMGTPVEYARTVTDWPSRDGWNHDWKKVGA